MPSRQRPSGCPFPPRSLPDACPCFYGGVIVLLMACVKVHRSFGVSSIYAFTVPTMMAESGLPDAQFSTVYGAATLAGAVFQFRWGRLIDRYGARVALPGFLCMLGAGLTGMTFCGPVLSLFSSFSLHFLFISPPCPLHFG